jgi:predicted HD superfamily hydrolase involved in NAD metabolism
MTQKEIKTDLKKKLSDNRYNHTLGVSYSAEELAINYTDNVNSAKLAGLLHDCAKWMNEEEMLSYCKKYKLPISFIEEKNPALLHGKIGADLAKRRYNIVDKEILQAINYHTTGHPNMTTLDKIIYIADYIEPNRKPLNGIEEMRKEAFEDLDYTVYMILKSTLNYLETTNEIIDPLTKETYEYYKEIIHGFRTGTY